MAVAVKFCPLVTELIILYILPQNFMPAQKKKSVSLLKLSAVVFGVFLVLFFLINNVVMPAYVQLGKTTTVPNVVGLPAGEAIRVLAEAGLEGKKAETRSDKQYPEGTVSQQNPPAGAEVKFGRGVYLTISGGERLVSVPGLKGKSIRDATFTLEHFNLKLGTITYEVSQDFPENTIMGQEIHEGAQVQGGTAVNLVVSQGPSNDRVPVPDVLKKSLSDAERIILQAGFTMGNVTHQLNPDLLPNTVIDQFPRPGELVSTGQAIDLFVSQKSEKKPFPEY